MKRLIYQVCLGEAKKSKLYQHCIQSVADYCEKYGFDHIVQKSAKLRIKPDVFSTNRSKESYEKHGGFLPIYEKENAFDYTDRYDQIAIVDADIYIRPTAPNIFDDFGTEESFGAVVEMDMPINAPYMAKIKNYSHMQYMTIGSKMPDVQWRYDPHLGWEFMNMGLILLNCESFAKHLHGMTAKQFLEQHQFKDFIDGKGAWKWSTDQTLLNYWIRAHHVPYKKMDWKWNGLFSALQKGKIEEAHFVHFFLKDKLPNSGEDVESLMKQI
jgi:hypothetical protein